MKTFFISDTHFGHNNIIKYENRPFENTEEMDKALIKAWNNTVGKDDVVWFLGDFTLSGNKEYIKDLVSQLKGRKRMIIGNHDRLKPQFYRDAGFEFVSEYPVILKHHFILSHAPMDQMIGSEDFFFIYGHVHSSPNYETTTNNSRCVCCERQNYRPITLPEYDSYTE